MRSFQYQILLRSIPTNKYLNMCKIKDTDRCYFCESEAETIEHVFWLCPIVRAFWLSISDKLHDVFDIAPFLNKKTVLLGCTFTENDDLINHMFNIIKRYVYVTKCTDNQLNTNQVLNILKYYYKLEKSIVKFRECNASNFESKWKPIESLL